MTDFNPAAVAVYISTMGPHHRAREGGKLLIACAEHIVNLNRAVRLLEQQLQAGSRLAYQDCAWRLFTKDGDGIVSGKSLVELLVQLGAPDDCSDA